MRVEVDPELIQRYTRPVPRYTSYPTAPHFSTDVDAAAFDAAVETGANRDERCRPLSLYLHLPFCRQLCHYCGCHMKITRDSARIARYLSYLKREIDRFADRLDVTGEVVQIHWGGGTPTYLSPDQIEALGRHLHERFAVAPDAEISIEADPRGLTRSHLEAARRVGFNRLSMGVQDFHPEVQEAINRVQPERLTRRAVRWARELGFRGINLDLVYGLPHQTAARFAETVGKVIDIGPDRIALFSYAHVPEVKKHQRLIDEVALPGPAAKLSIFKTALEALVDVGGYRFIGMDHFARPDDELARAQDAGRLHRNFQGYSTRAGADVVAFGISGISQLDGLYAQNVKALRPYYDRIDAGRGTVYRGVRLTPEDRLRRRVIMELMCQFRLDKRTVEGWGEALLGTPIAFDRYFEEPLAQLQPLAADGLVTCSEEAVEVEPVGRLLIRNVAAAFDAYLRLKNDAEQPVYSQSV